MHTHSHQRRGLVVFKQGEPGRGRPARAGLKSKEQRERAAVPYSPYSAVHLRQMSKMLIVMMVLMVSVVSVVVGVLDHSTRTEEIMLPARDGTKLHTRLVFPRKMTSEDKYTVVMDRSPYGYTGLEWFSDLFVPVGFVGIGQDMRGTGLSEGNFTVWHADADDSQDLGDWIVQQPWSNGKVYTIGASADGMGSFTTLYNNPTWLDSQYIIWSTSRAYEVLFPNGAYLEDLASEWMYGTVDHPEGWAKECLSQVTANEASSTLPYWNVLEGNADYYSHVHGPSGFWAGWYDIFLVGNLAAYNGFNTQSAEAVRHQSRITIDPLGHCQDASKYFTQNLVEGRTALALAQMYETYGVRPVSRTDIHNVTFYVMSSNDDAGLAAGMYWTSMETFPEPTMTKFFLHSDASLSASVPSSEEGESTSFKYDPADPVPTVGGNNLFLECGPVDQQVVDTRADVIKFTTPVFEQEMALTGPLYANLFVSSSAIDTDFTVKITDLYPDGRLILVQDADIRMRWREQTSATPVYMVPGEVYEVRMSLWNTSYIVAPGHALRVSISSSNAPRFSVNRNNGLLLNDPAYPGENITAINTIFHSSKYPTSVELPVVKKNQLPQLHNLKEQVGAAYAHVDAREYMEKHVDLMGELAERELKTLRAKASRNK